MVFWHENYFKNDRGWLFHFFLTKGDNPRQRGGAPHTYCLTLYRRHKKKLAGGVQKFGRMTMSFIRHMSVVLSNVKRKRERERERHAAWVSIRNGSQGVHRTPKAFLLDLCGPHGPPRASMPPLRGRRSGGPRWLGGPPAGRLPWSHGVHGQHMRAPGDRAGAQT